MKKATWFALVLVTGWLLGSFLGQFLSVVAPDGRVREVFAWEQVFGLRPTVLDLRILKLTLGAEFRVSGVSLAGLVVAAFFFRGLLRSSEK